MEKLKGSLIKTNKVGDFFYKNKRVGFKKLEVYPSKSY